MIAIGFGCVAFLAVVFAMALCRAGGLADRMVDRAFGTSGLEADRQQHYAACDEHARPSATVTDLAAARRRRIVEEIGEQVDRDVFADARGDAA